MTEQDEREAYNEELRQQAENDSTHIPASGRQQAAEMLREARRGGCDVRAVVWGCEWEIDAGAGGRIRVTIRP